MLLISCNCVSPVVTWRNLTAPRKWHPKWHPIFPMARLNLLTDIEILNAPRRPAHYMLGDGGNLYLRVLAGHYADKRDGKDWWFRYQSNGTRVKLALGSYTDVRTKDARQRADELRKLVDAGIDPVRKRAADDAARHVVAQQPQSINELFEDWKAKRLGIRKDHGKEVERMFVKDVLPTVGAIPIGMLRRRDLTTILDAVRLRGAKRVAGQLLGELRLFVTYAVNRELIEGDITAGLKAADWDGQTKVRKRALTEDEIRELHKKLPSSGMKATTVAAIWIMASTMCRAGAISKARWDDIDFEKRIWKAAEKSREDDEYEIYLSEFSMRYFRALKADQDALIRRKQIHDPDLDLTKYQWVFPAKNPLPTGTPQHVNEKAFSKQIYAQQVDVQMKGRVPAVGRLKLPGGKWSAHDLRRTGSTLMAKIGIDDKFRELCLNHGPKNPLDRVYNQHKYRKQMTRAWKLLGERLESLQHVAQS